MKVLELFAGSCSFSKVAQEKGYKTFTTDIEQFGDIDYITDILDFDYSKVPFQPDVIWASPPCTFFSVASIGKHWNKDHTPKTENAKLGIQLIQKTLEVIDYYKPKYWYIENPRGKLRKIGLIDGIRYTVTYCQYGDTRMKPTDIWTNNENWQPRDMCENGMPCHQAAPRGSQTGTQGLKNNFERSKVPKELCKEILLSSKK